MSQDRTVVSRTVSVAPFNEQDARTPRHIKKASPNVHQQLPDGRVAARVARQQPLVQPDMPQMPQQAPSVADFVQERLGVGQPQSFERAPQTPVAPPVWKNEPRPAPMNTLPGTQAEQGFAHTPEYTPHPYRQHPTQGIGDTVIHHAPVEELGAPPFSTAPEGISVALPSKFAFYPFKDLFVHPLRGKHLAKLNRAHVERSMLTLAEVISDTLSTSDPQWNSKALAFYLTVPDFYWVMSFQRQNSFTKSSFVWTTKCTNPVHIKEVEEGKKSVDSLKITELVTRSHLQNVELTEIPYPDPEIMGQYKVKPATLGDMISITEHPDFGKPDFDFASQIAAYLDGPDFETRLKMVDDLTADQVRAIQEYEKSISDYGIQETINVRCKECGASRKTNVSIDASTFLA